MWNTLPRQIWWPSCCVWHMACRGWNAVTLVVLGGFGSCFDVFVAHDALCIADTSGMPEHHVFTSMHARPSKQWLESLWAATRNATGSLLTSTEDTAMQTRTEGLQTWMCNLFYHLNTTAASQHSQMVQPSSSTEVHKSSCANLTFWNFINPCERNTKVEVRMNEHLLYLAK